MRPTRAMTSNEPRWWTSVLACPRCRRALESVSRCEGCGARYGVDGATPVLVAEDAVADVRFSFPHRRSVKTDEDHALVRYPPSEPHPTPLPYHLDPAHAAVLGRSTPGARVLEVGCGGGQLRAWVERRGMEYLGTDLSRAGVQERLRSPGGPDLLCDAHFLPLQDAQFDVVCSAAVTQYLACPIQHALEVRRVLKPGGYFLGNAAFLEPWDVGSHFHLSPDGAIELLLEGGFEIEAVWPGRGWSAFRAIPAMTLRGPFRPLRALGLLPAVALRAQTWARRARWRLLGQEPRGEALLDAVVAGTIDWIARRPRSA